MRRSQAFLGVSKFFFTIVHLGWQETLNNNDRWLRGRLSRFLVAVAVSVTVTVTVSARAFSMMVNGLVDRHFDRVGLVHRHGNVLFNSNGHWFFHRHGNMLLHRIWHLLLDWHRHCPNDLYWDWMRDRNRYRVGLRYTDGNGMWHIDFHWVRYRNSCKKNKCGL